VALSAVKIVAGLHPSPAGKVLMPADQTVIAVAQPDPETPAADAPVADAPVVDAPGENAPAVLIEEELLVEDVSIDGMCGVY
jgi:mycofactocin precursor